MRTGRATKGRLGTEVAQRRRRRGRNGAIGGWVGGVGIGGRTLKLGGGGRSEKVWGANNWNEPVLLYKRNSQFDMFHSDLLLGKL